MKHMRWQKIFKHIRWMLHEHTETILEGVLLLLMQKRCNYQVLWATISNEWAIKHNVDKHVVWIVAIAANTQTNVDKMFDKSKASVIIYEWYCSTLQISFPYF